MAEHNPFAIDRLRADRQAPLAELVEAGPTKLECVHPSWVSGGDGHGHTWWNCFKCGEWRWIHPAFLRGPDVDV